MDFTQDTQVTRLGEATQETRLPDSQETTVGRETMMELEEDAQPSPDLLRTSSSQRHQPEGQVGGEQLDQGGSGLRIQLTVAGQNLGLALAVGTSTGEVLVAAVDDKAELNGKIQPGDVLTQVSGRDVASAAFEQVESWIKYGPRPLLLVFHRQTAATMEVPSNVAAGAEVGAGGGQDPMSQVDALSSFMDQIMSQREDSMHRPPPPCPATPPGGPAAARSSPPPSPKRFVRTSGLGNSMNAGSRTRAGNADGFSNIGGGASDEDMFASARLPAPQARTSRKPMGGPGGRSSSDSGEKDDESCPQPPESLTQDPASAYVRTGSSAASRLPNAVAMGASSTVVPFPASVTAYRGTSALLPERTPDGKFVSRLQIGAAPPHTPELHRHMPSPAAAAVAEAAATLSRHQTSASSATAATATAAAGGSNAPRSTPTLQPIVQLSTEEVKALWDRKIGLGRPFNADTLTNQFQREDLKSFIRHECGINSKLAGQSTKKGTLVDRLMKLFENPSGTLRALFGAPSTRIPSASTPACAAPSAASKATPFGSGSALGVYHASSSASAASNVPWTFAGASTSSYTEPAAAARPVSQGVGAQTEVYMSNGQLRVPASLFSSPGAQAPGYTPTGMQWLQSGHGSGYCHDGLGGAATWAGTARATAGAASAHQGAEDDDWEYASIDTSGSWSSCSPPFPSSPQSRSEEDKMEREETERRVFAAYPGLEEQLARFQGHSDKPTATVETQTEWMGRKRTCRA